MFQGGSNFLSNTIKTIERGFKFAENSAFVSSVKTPAANKVGELAKNLLGNSEIRAQKSQLPINPKSFFFQQLPIAKKELGLPLFVMKVHSTIQSRSISSTAHDLDLNGFPYLNKFEAATRKLEVLAALSRDEHELKQFIEKLDQAKEGLRKEYNSENRSILKDQAYLAIKSLVKQLQAEFLDGQKLTLQNPARVEKSAALSSLFRVKENAIDALSML